MVEQTSKLLPVAVVCARAASGLERANYGPALRLLSTHGAVIVETTNRVARGFMRRDAEKAWRNWNPLIWGVIRYRGCFGEPPKAEPVTKAPPRRRTRLQKLFTLHN